MDGTKITILLAGLSGLSLLIRFHWKLLRKGLMLNDSLSNCSLLALYTDLYDIVCRASSNNVLFDSDEYDRLRGNYTRVVPFLEFLIKTGIFLYMMFYAFILLIIIGYALLLIFNDLTQANVYFNLLQDGFKFFQFGGVFSPIVATFVIVVFMAFPLIIFPLIIYLAFYSYVYSGYVRLRHSVLCFCVLK